MSDYKYYLAPIKWDGTVYSKPDGAAGMLDLRSVSNEPGIVFCYGDGVEGECLGRGDMRTLKCNQRTQDLWFSQMGTRPNKEGTLAQMLGDHVTNHIDSVFMPIGNTVQINLPRHGRVWTREYKFGENSLYESRLFKRHQKEFTTNFDDSPELARKSLGFKMISVKQPFHNRTAWTKFVPRNLQSSIQGPSLPASKNQDLFNRANGNLGANWNEFDLGLAIVNNAVEPDLNDDVGAAYHTTPLSSIDHDCQITMLANVSDGRGIGPITRKENNATSTYYLGWPNSDTELVIAKLVAGTPTIIGTVPFTYLDNQTLRIKCLGSTQYLYLNNNLVLTTSDSAIATGLYTGIRAYRNTTPAPRLDKYMSTDVFGRNKINQRFAP